MTGRPGTVQWPPATLCSHCGGSGSSAEINGEPVCGDCYEELSADADYAALNRIAEILRGECGADQIGEITQIVAATGRTVGA